MATPVAPVMGFNGKLYYRSAGDYENPTWTELANVGDIDVTDEMEEKEIALRSQAGFMVLVPGLRKLSYAWKMLYDPDDDGQADLKEAYLGRTTLEFLILDGEVDTDGPTGIRGTFLVTKFPRTEELSNAMMIEVAIKPALNADNPIEEYAAEEPAP